jgi:LuxR family maltose regulon positive regulatory protein
MRTYEQGLQLATAQTVQGAPVLRGAADMHVGISALYREHNDLDVATQHLLKSKDLGEYNGFPQNRYRWCVAMARTREAEGDLDGALDLLHEAERAYVRDFFPNVHPVAAMKSRVWVMQGRLGEAKGWARQQGLSAQDSLSYLRDFEHITLARLLLAQYRSDHDDHAERFLLEAMELLRRLLNAAEEGGRAGSALEILVLQALAYHAQGDMPAALLPLKQALALAEPEGYVRMFLDEGMPMEALLREAAKRGIAQSYVRRLLVAFGETGKAKNRPVSIIRTKVYGKESKTKLAEGTGASSGALMLSAPRCRWGRLVNATHPSSPARPT